MVIEVDPGADVGSEDSEGHKDLFTFPLLKISCQLYYLILIRLFNMVICDTKQCNTTNVTMVQ